jgi:hypothetical protein
LTLRDDILQEQRELLLEGLKPLLEDDIQSFGSSPLEAFGISAEEIWVAVLNLATADEKVFVERILELVLQCIKHDTDNEYPHTRWFLSYMRGWIKTLKTAGEIKKTSDFNSYYGLRDFPIGLGD